MEGLYPHEIVRVARQLGWKVWAYSVPKTIHSNDEDDHASARVEAPQIAYVLRSPNGVPFTGGEPAPQATALPQDNEMPVLESALVSYSVKYRLTEEEAWRDLPGEMWELLRHSRRV